MSHTFARAPRSGASWNPAQAKRKAWWLQIDVEHPETTDIFQITCVTRRRVSGGVGLEFQDMDEARRAKFYQFVFIGAPAGGADEVLMVELDHPKLV